VAHTEFGPRRRALLTAWGEHAAQTATGPGFDFTPDNRTQRTQAAVDAFITEPTTEKFESLWMYDTLADSIIGGANTVLDDWNEDLEALAAQLETMATAPEYNPAWELRFPSETAVWELYGRLQPEAAPIVYSECLRGFREFGYDQPDTFDTATARWAEFRDAYLDIAGYATEDTPHEVPLNHEISELFTFLATQDDGEIIEVLQSSDGYYPLSRWRQEGTLESELQLQGHESHLEGFIEAKQRGGLTEDGPENLWNRGYWEDWKQEYREHFRTTIEPKYQLTALTAADIEPLLGDLAYTASLGTTIPAYMLGGRQGGILWSEFKKQSLVDPERTATVLSYLFDEDEYIGVRMDRFAELYGSLDEGGGALLSLATILLTFAYPREYVFYKWSLMSSFFTDFAGYDVGTGYDTDQYWKLNLACREQLLSALEDEFEDATLLDIHTLLYVYHKEYAES
jgi:hypothetical protein